MRERLRLGGLSRREREMAERYGFLGLRASDAFFVGQGKGMGAVRWVLWGVQGWSVADVSCVFLGIDRVVCGNRLVCFGRGY